MKRKKILIISAVSIILLSLLYFLLIRENDKKVEYSFVEVTRGNLKQTITSTGTLQALSTVEVGTQVSARITRLYADFNSSVRKGQLLAILDTTLLAAQVRDSKANLDKAKAQYNEARIVHQKNSALYEKEYISELEFLTSQTNLESALAAVNSAESMLQRARTNLGYAFIYAPISGKVLNRSVEEGQTVAASLSAPTLFTIAEDLSHMKILASVDESDIGQIVTGQKVDFSVQAYPERKFTGEVVQVRMNSEVVQNVVNYTVVVNADNFNNLLLPGMTATLDFYIQERENVLIVPNSALRFTPPDDLIKDVQQDTLSFTRKVSSDTSRKRGNANDTTLRNQRNRDITTYSGIQGNEINTRRGKSQFGKLWYLDKEGKLHTTSVVLGITDGKNSEIVRGNNITEGMKIISGIVEDQTKGNNPTGNTLIPTQNQRGMRRGL